MQRFLRTSIVTAAAVVMLLFATPVLAQSASAGTLELTCDIQNALSIVDGAAACSVLIDGAAPAENASLAAGASASYVLDAGKHQVDVAMVGDKLDHWTTNTFSKTVSIPASATPVKVKASFIKKGRLFVQFRPYVYGYFTIDGVTVNPLKEDGSSKAVQFVEVWVKPNTSHKVEALAYGGETSTTGCWQPAKQSVSVAAGKEKTLTLKLKIAGCWVAFPELAVKDGAWTPDAHTYTTQFSACDNQADGTPYTYNFSVSADAPLYAGTVYLWQGKITRMKPYAEKPQVSLAAINPAQKVKFMMFYWWSATKPTAADLAHCSALTVSIDGGAAQAMAMGQPYQTKP
jgi:hypothetical protein